MIKWLSTLTNTPEITGMHCSDTYLVRDLDRDQKGVGVYDDIYGWQVYPHHENFVVTHYCKYPEFKQTINN